MNKRIVIFLSSTINECEDERREIRLLLKRLDHDFFIFEMEGASPHPPRELYSKGIREADIFIGIYKNSYGHIAEGMNISGIEDEYWLAKEYLKPKFVYIANSETDRDEKLKFFIREVVKNNDLTFYKYKNKEDLLQTIQQDITTHIAEIYQSSKELKSLQRSSLEAQFRSSIGNTTYVERETVLILIEQEIQKRNLINLYGPPGTGKTTFLTKLALNKNYVYVPGRYLTPREILIKITEDLNKFLGEEGIVNFEFEKLQQNLKLLWQKSNDLVLVIDDINFASGIIFLVKELHEINSKNIFIVSSQIPIGEGFERIKLDYLLTHEIDFASNSLLSEDLLSIIEEVYRKNPEIIKNIEALSSGSIDRDSLLTRTIWNNSSAIGKDILIWLCLAFLPIQIGDLRKLSEKEDLDIQEFFSAIEGVRILIKESPLGYEIASEEIRTELIEIIKTKPAKLAYYSMSLTNWFIEKGDHISGFYSGRIIEDSPSIENIRLAAKQASIEWNLKALKDILTTEIEIYLKNDEKENAIYAFLGLAQAQEHLGDYESARESLERAKTIVENLENSEELRVVIEENFLIQEIKKSHTEDKWQQLVNLKNQYIKSGDLIV